MYYKPGNMLFLEYVLIVWLLTIGLRIFAQKMDMPIMGNTSIM